MRKINASDMVFANIRTGWHRALAWVIFLGVMTVLGTVRFLTDAELSFASLALLPVLAIAWMGGRSAGLVAAAVAACMWAISEFASGRTFSAPWVPWVNAATRCVAYSIVVLLSDRLRQRFEREHELAIQDGLTGLLNRRAFFEAGTIEVVRSRRYAHSMAVVFVDLDDFKQVNDSMGHEAGDRALRAAAETLLRVVRASDRVARLGGDEFAVLLPEIEYAAAVSTAEKLRVEIDAALAEFPPVRASLGVAWFGQVDRDFPAMLQAADALLYEAKERGKATAMAASFAASD